MSATTQPFADLCAGLATMTIFSAHASRPIVVPRVSPLIVALAGFSCTSEGLQAQVQHFDPPSSTVLPGVNSLITVVNLDSEPGVCYSTDGSTPAWNDGNCGPKLEANRQIAVPNCGFNLIRIAWSSERMKPATRSKARPAAQAARPSCPGRIRISRWPWPSGPTRSSAR